MKALMMKAKGLFAKAWDERQQQDYRRINSGAYNILWGLLLLAILAQVLLFPREPLRWLPEMGIFLLINLYTGIRYYRAGLWSATGQPSRRQSVLGSLAAALILTLLSLLRMALSTGFGPVRVGRMQLSAPIFLLWQVLLVFVVAYHLLNFVADRHRKRQQAVEQALDEEE